MTLHLIKTKKYDDNDFVAMGLFFSFLRLSRYFIENKKMSLRLIFEYVSINVFLISNGPLFDS